MSDWIVKSETVLPKGDNPMENRFYGYRIFEFTLPDGQNATYFGLVVPNCVHVVAVEADETTHLVRQRRPNVMAVGALEVPETLELPGGFADPNITLEQSAQGELETEIGRHAGTLTEVGTIWPSVGVSNEQDHIFMGTELSPVDNNDHVEATEQDMRIVSGKFGDLYEQMQRDRLPVSAQTLAAMSKVAILL